MKQSKWDTVLAWWRMSLWARPLTLFVALALVAVVTFYAYKQTHDGTYLRELTVAAIGSLLTIVGAIGVAPYRT